MKRLKTTLIATSLSILLVGCGKSDPASPLQDPPGNESSTQTEGSSPAITLSPDAVQIAGIQIEEARRMQMQAELKVPGVVTNSAHGKAVVTPPVAGKVTRILASVGDRVAAGQPIAELQSSELALAAAQIIEAQRDVSSAQAAVREASAELDLAKSNFKSSQANLERQKQFANTGAFSQPGIHQAQRELNESETELQAALQEHIVHEAQLERAERLFKQELISKSELEEARLEVQKDKLRQEKAKRQIEIAKSAFAREKAIAERGLMNSKEIQFAEAELRSSSLEVEQTKIKVRSAQAAHSGAGQGLQAARASYAALSGGSQASGGKVIVTAPISGIITDREATLGQALERTSEICHVENLRSVWVTASVPEKEISKARMGAATQVTVKAFPGRIFSGVVQVVGSRLDPKTRTMPVQVLVDNVDGSLRADMFASVSLGIGRKDEVLAIRRSALVEDSDTRSVFVELEAGKFLEKGVETGRKQGDYIEIVSGLDPGDKVVVKGAFILRSEKIKSQLKGEE